MNINLTAPINKLSYGIVSRNLVFQLDKLGHNISLWTIGNTEVDKQSEIPTLQKTIGNQAIFDNNSPSVRLFHQFSLEQHVGKGLHVGFPIFELDNFSDREKRNLSAQDRLFVCSNWAKEVVSKHLPNLDVRVIPLGTDRSIFYENSQPLDHDGLYTFLHIGKLEVRKRELELLECFNRAFEKDDNVELIFMTFNPFLSQEDMIRWQSKCNSSKLGDKITILDYVETQHHLAGIMRQCDCLISLSSAEGWNLPLLDGMSCGKPIIATNYSAHTEFCTRENSYLIDVDDLEVAQDNKWFDGKIGSWGKIGESQKAQTVEYMRNVVKNNIRTNPTGVETAKKFSWENSARLFVENLE